MRHFLSSFEGSGKDLNIQKPDIGQKGKHCWHKDFSLMGPSHSILLTSSFVTTNFALQFSSHGMRPGFTTVLARHLDKNTMGYLQWRWGIQSAMNTSIVRDTKTSHFTVAFQVRAFSSPPRNCCFQEERRHLVVYQQEKLICIHFICSFLKNHMPPLQTCLRRFTAKTVNTIKNYFSRNK